MSPKPATTTDALLPLAVDLCPAGMLAIDANGLILLVNREVEALFGYTREELVGQSIERLVPERFRHEHSGFRAGYSRDPKTRPMGAGRDLFGLRKDGSEVPVEIGLNPVETEAGRVVFASVVDISARRLVEAQLRQSQKMQSIGTLAGGIAHDFNNILLGITGYTELAMEPGATESARRTDLEQVLRTAERGRQLVQRILSFSRQRDVARVPTDLVRSCNEALHLVRASLPVSIELRVLFDPRTPRVRSDETQLHQVLLNLATNAAHAMPNGGVLEVGLEPLDVDDPFAREHPGLSPGRHAHLYVRDTGTGMSAEVIERAFEPFFTTKAPSVGTGFGLSIVHGIVKSHGGVIALRSKLGEGSCVDVFLPACELSSHAGSTRRQSILLVDDEPMLASMLQRQIAALGYAVTAHTSSVDAFERFRQGPNDFDLLITDNSMPVLTGLALAREVTRIRPELPVLLISGFSEPDGSATLQAHGVRKLLAKPHSGAQLAHEILALIGPPTGTPSSQA